MRAFLLLVTGMWVFSLAAYAGNAPDEYTQFLRARSEVGPLKVDDMFGDRIGLFTGSIEFLQTDVEIPGNNNLEVAVRRKLRGGSQGVPGLFADWDLAIPSVHGVYSKSGWKNWWANDPWSRCSKFYPPPDETVRVDFGNGLYATKQFSANDFFTGVFLYLPGPGDEDVLNPSGASWPTPTNGYSYTLRTKSKSAVRCIPAQNDVGEAFEVLTPEGITYRLDHMAYRLVAPMFKSQQICASYLGGCQNIQFVLERREYFMLPSSATDKFGNTVTYTWSSTDPWQLNQISSSDGRVLNITTIKDAAGLSRITQVSNGTQVWSYNYATGGLTKVTLPDQSTWEFAPGLTTNTTGGGSIPATGSYCYNPGVAGYTRVGSIKHPSGALAVFNFAPTLHGRAWAPYSCSMSDPTMGGFEVSVENFPAKYYMWSITSKTISGPGIPSYRWTYTYGANNGCYADTDLGGIRCQNSSPTTKTVDVTDPSGVTTHYTFGNRWGVDEGNLLSTSKPGQSVTNSYDLSGSGPYPAYAGSPISSLRGQGEFANKIVPLRQKTIVQDGVVFDWTVNAFDSLARPVSVTRSSRPGP